MNNNLSTSIIIFGASGDLTQRKLIPSLFNLSRKSRLRSRLRLLRRRFLLLLLHLPREMPLK